MHKIPLIWIVHGIQSTARKESAPFVCALKRFNSIQFDSIISILSDVDYASCFCYAGADELMKGAGKDATKLFDDVHAWVNYEQLLTKCFVGPLRTTLTINLDVSGNSSRAKSINQLASSTTPHGCFKGKTSRVMGQTKVISKCVHFFYLSIRQRPFCPF